jgi:hypothetical protein
MFSNQLAKNWKYKWYGFWGAEVELEGREYDLDEYIDYTCPTEILEKILFYLSNAPEISSAQQPSQECFFCNEQLYLSVFKSDGVWLWNESLSHYVGKHHFCIPNEMVSHILLSDGIPPTKINIPLDRLPWP